MVQFVFLDLDDTLLDFHKAEGVALTGALRLLGVEPTPEVLRRYSEINRQHWELLEAGKLARAQVLLGRFQVLFAERGITASPQAAQDAYERFLSHGHYFIPGAPELLKALAPRYALYLASNGTAAVQEGRIRSAGIAPCFREIFISQRIGANKPNPAFFDACFARIPGFRRDTAVMVGDSLTSDMRGGLAAGLRTCWFNPRHLPGRAEIPVTAEFDRLEQLPGILERM